jgi:hypothetical protein
MGDILLGSDVRESQSDQKVQHWIFPVVKPTAVVFTQ